MRLDATSFADRRLSSLLLVVALTSGGCNGSAPPSNAPSPPSSTPIATLTGSPTASVGPSSSPFELGGFPPPTSGPLPAATTAALQTVLDRSVERGLPGIAATVIVAGRGIWSGAAGSADGSRPLEPDAAFDIASVTKTVIATQVLRLVEAGTIGLDDPMDEHLPADIDVDTNHATIRDLLAMESGIPEPAVVEDPNFDADPGRAWTLDEVLDSIPEDRSERGSFRYSNTSYILLGLVIADATGMSVAEALRSGVLADPRFDRIVYQPDERPIAPLALPFLGGKVRPDILGEGGGYLPDRAAITTVPSAGCIAADAVSLALWAYDLFGGRLLSEPSLLAMTDFGEGTSRDGYGLGVFDFSSFVSGAPAVGNGGWESAGYAAHLVVIPSRGTVIVVLTNTSTNPATTLGPVSAGLSLAVRP